MSKLKSFFAVLIISLSIFVTAACSNSKSTVEIISVTPMRTSIGVTVKVSDPYAEITSGSLVAQIYSLGETASDDYVLQSVKFDETEIDEQTLTFDDLDTETTYRVVLTATINDKKKTYYKQKVATILIGNEENPIEIDSKEDLLAMSRDTTAYYKLVSDIDFAVDGEATVVDPIFSSSVPFKGHLDGNGKTILNFKQTKVTTYVGLFGYLDKKSTIKNLKITNASIEVEKTGEFYAGVLAGYSAATINNVEITNSKINVKGSTTAVHYVGGLLGVNVYKVSDSKVTGLTITSTNRKQSIIGGLIGSNGGVTFPAIYGAHVDNCYAEVNITSDLKNITTSQTDFEMLQYIGGFVGETRVSISDSLAVSVLKVDSSKYSSSNPKTYTNSVGGFAGRVINGAKIDSVAAVSTITFTSADCYKANIGTLVGESYDGQIINSASASKGENIISITSEYEPLEKAFGLVAKVDNSILVDVGSLSQSGLVNNPNLGEGSLEFDSEDNEYDLSKLPEWISSIIKKLI